MDDDKLITIDQFVAMVDMTRQWFYKHHGDEGMPKRIYVNRSAKLSLRECRDYVERLKKARPTGRKRGRPRKEAAATPPA